MVDKNPILNFNPREFDSGKTPGGGNTDKPSWTLKEQELAMRAERLSSEIDGLNVSWDDNEKYGFSKLIDIEFIEKAKAKSHQKKILDLFSGSGGVRQVGMSSEFTMTLKIKNADDFRIIKEKLSDPERNDVSISAIQQIQSFEPIFNTSGKSAIYKVSLIDYLIENENKGAYCLIEKRLTEHKIDFSALRYGNKPVIEIREDNLDKLTFIKQLPIKSLEPMEETPPFRFQSIKGMPDVPLLEFDPTKRYPLIGLMDSGVTQNKYTKGWVTRGNGCQYEENNLDTTHGTYISTLLIHGDRLNNYSDSESVGCIIIEVPIVPKKAITEVELVGNIERAVQQNPEIDIWNLSVSLSGEISENRFSDFSIELDRIQAENNVLFFKSAGNDDSFYRGGQAGKLSIGAETIHGVTVGAMNRASDNFGFTKAEYPAPYLRRGRGPASIIKPDLSFYGGDVFATKKNPTQYVDFATIGEMGFGANEEEIYQVGTSFSTPKVAKIAAEIADYLEMEDFNPLLIKALLIHSASYSNNLLISEEDKIEKLGFGKPKPVSNIVFSSLGSSTLLLKGELEKGKNIDILNFPFPKTMVENGKFKGRLTATLVYNPYLEGELGSEYCQSNLQFKLGTYDNIVPVEGRFAVFNPYKREGSKNIFLNSIYSKKKINQNTQFGTERLQIKYGDKYYPVKKYTYDLKELSPTNEKYITEDKKWYLFLEGQYRNFVQDKYDGLEKGLAMEYCLLISITDPEEDVDVYTGIVQSLEENNFVYNEVQVGANIQVEHDID